MRRFFKTLKICVLVFNARTFGKYRISIGGPDHYDYHVYEYDGLVVCLPDVKHQIAVRKLGADKLRISFVGKNCMYLLHIYWLYYDHTGEPYNVRSLFCIRQFWIWHLIFGRKMKRYRLTIRYIDLFTMQSEILVSRKYRWKWFAHIHKFLINNGPRFSLGMLVANVEETPHG